MCGPRCVVVVVVVVAFYMSAVSHNMLSLRLGGHRYLHARIPPELFGHIGTPTQNDMNALVSSIHVSCCVLGLVCAKYKCSVGL